MSINDKVEVALYNFCRDMGWKLDFQAPSNVEAFKQFQRSVEIALGGKQKCNSKCM